ncbi:hypothetical protein GGR52DRAFT_240465 [Hypoxylon sp. FL1284]|nr:hypothetical protein GGR52DRAFT_240465 [Hypoxylon sp. FL1284]
MKHLSDSGSTNLWTTVAMLVLSVVSVAIRFAIRRWGRIPLSWSDWLLLPGLATIAVDSGLIINYIVNGPGPGTYDLNEVEANFADGGAVWATAMMKVSSASQPSLLPSHLTELYIGDLFFGLAITLVKLSILTFYREIFAVSRTFQRWNWAVSALCVAWLLVTTFCNAFQCSPPSALWEYLGSTEYCIASGPLWLGYELTNFFLDVMILVLPLAMVHRLHLRTAQKWSIASIFLLGGLVCVASIIRMVYIWHPDSPDTVSISQVQVLSEIQLGTAVLCACLPTYGPLLNFVRRAVRRVKRNLGISVPKTSGHSGGSGPSDKDSTRRLEYYRMDDRDSGAHAASASTNDFVEAHPLSDIPPRSIMVSKSVRIS